MPVIIRLHFFFLVLVIHECLLKHRGGSNKVLNRFYLDFLFSGRVGGWK